MTKIMKGGVAYNSTANMVALTQAEYNSLSTAQKNNGNFYFIVDSDPSYFSAENIDYDNTDSGLTSTDIQAAIDEVVDTTYTKTQADTLLGGKLDSSYLVKTNNGSFPALVTTNTVWLVAVQRVSVNTSCVLLIHNYNSNILVKEIVKDSGMAYLTNNQGTVSITYGGSGESVRGGAYRLY